MDYFHQTIRVPFRWSDLRLQSTRTLARNLLAFQATVPSELRTVVNTLLKPKNKPLFPHDSTDVLKAHLQDPELGLPTSLGLQKALKQACPELHSLGGASVADVDLCSCRQVAFHHDDTNVERHAYVAWVLGTSRPMDFTWAGSVWPVEAGTVLVFDAQRLHALLSRGQRNFRSYRLNDYTHRMVFALGTVELTKALRERMGIECKPASDIDNFRRMGNAIYSARTGEFEQWTSRRL